MNPFDFVNAISDNKRADLFDDPQAHKDYSSFLINKSLSYYPDTVLYVNEMNQRYSIDKDWQFFFLLNSIAKRKRFSRWAKKDAESEYLGIVMEYFGYSINKAKEALGVLTNEQLTMIKEKLQKGGR